MNSKIAELISAATELVSKRNDDLNHTVASAVLTEGGKIVSSMNLHHFTGGLCAEVAALARVASDGEMPVLIVAVGNRGRGVLAPCGRCRQVMLDYYPQIQVIVPSGQGNEAKDIKELLPSSYIWSEQ